MEFQTEYLFTLPKGYIDEDGNIHKEGIMRIATAGSVSADQYHGKAYL